MKKTLLLILLTSLIVSGCDYQIYKANPVRQQREENTQGESSVDTYQTKLYFVEDTTTSLFAVDDKGKVHEIDKNGDDSIEAGMVANKAEISVVEDEDVEVTYSDVVRIVDNPVIFTASSEEAPMISMKELLNRYKYSSDRETAISDFTVTDSKVIERFGENKIKILTNYSVTPDPLSYYWGERDAAGLVTGLSTTYTILGVGDTWMIGEAVEPYLQGGATKAVAKTAYKPQDNQKVLFETDTWTYYREFLYKDENSEDTNIYRDCKSPVQRINRSSGNIKRMYSGDDNGDYIPFHLVDNKLYVTTIHWEEGTDTSPGYFGVLDVDRKYMTELIDRPVMPGTVIGNVGYLFTQTELIGFDFDTEKSYTVAELPIQPDLGNGHAVITKASEKSLSVRLQDTTGEVVEYTVDLESQEEAEN